MTRLLVVMDQGQRLPSGTIRALIYEDLLLADGFHTEFITRQPLHWLDKGPSLYQSLMRTAPVRNRVLKLGTERNDRRILTRARNVDVVYMNKVSSLRLIQALRRETKARLVYDFGDAVWLMNKDSRDEFDEILRTVHAVTTDNSITAEYIRQLNKNCTVIPDAPQIEKFDLARSSSGKKRRDQIVLGWIGSPATAFNLYLVWEALEDLFRRYENLHLRLVGTGTDPRLLPPFEHVRFSCRPFYNQTEMIDEALAMHIGLYPLQNTEACRVRGVLKATVYMSGEAATVASPVGQSKDFIEEGVNGLLAGSTDEWIQKLELLINNPDLREQIARNGLDLVRRNFRVEQSFAKLKAVLLSLNGNTRV